MQKRKNVVPAKPYVDPRDLNAILADFRKILESGWFTLGEYTRLFEEMFRDYVGTRFAIAVNSGTSALEATLRALGVGPGDEVIVPVNTFIATSNAVLYCGAKSVFVDIEFESLCVDPEQVKEKINSKTKAVIVVHIGGVVCPKIRELIEICEDYGVWLVEDAAHAHGSMINDQKAGSFGVAAAFSFYPTKVMTTGEGGMVTTDSEDVDRKVRILRDQGKSAFEGGQIVELGYNWRMTEFSAALGIYQLKKLEEFIEKRRALAKRYDEGLAKVSGIRPQRIPPGVRSNYYKYIAFLDEDIDKAQLKRELREKYGIRLGGEVYDPPLHLQPVYRKLFGFKGGEFPVAEEAARRHVCLPMHVGLSLEDVNYVIEALKEVLS